MLSESGFQEPGVGVTPGSFSPDFAFEPAVTAVQPPGWPLGTITTLDAIDARRCYLTA